MSETDRKKLLVVKTGSLRARAQQLVETFGDQEEIFSAAAGYGTATSEVIEVWAGAAIPHPPSHYRGILITGSGAMISDRAPWMENTAGWLRGAVAAEVPILGICFGHQLIAHALGGEVGPNPRGFEVGTIRVAFNEDAAADPLFASLPASADFGAHHYQSVLTRPAGAQVLGANGQDENQAVRFAPHAWGVQFHPEFGQAFMRALVDVVADDIVRAGCDPGAIRRSIDDMPQGPALLRRFMAIVGAPPRPAFVSERPVEAGRTLCGKQPAIKFVFPNSKLKSHPEIGDATKLVPGYPEEASRS